MQSVTDFDLLPSEAALWWLGQAGYIIRSANLTVVIDAYLSDSAGKNSPEFSRCYPPPLQAAELSADVYLVTHDHLDHLDPDTLLGYRHAETTWFVAPRFAARKLAALGIPRERIVVLNAGEVWTKDLIEVEAVYALPTGADVLDTVGFLIRFNNGRTVYHTGDTQFHPLVLEAAPRKPEVMLIPINGKWGNPGPEEAAEFAHFLKPRYVMPNHYDLMLLNAENPETFRWFCSSQGIEKSCVVTERMKPFVWGPGTQIDTN